MLQKQKNYVESKIMGRTNRENCVYNDNNLGSSNITPHISQVISNSKGITLVALVITVIVMLILAGVAISNITGENGIIEKTKQVADKYNNAAQKESEMINSYTDSIYTIYEINYAKVSFAYEPSNWTNVEVKVSLINTLEERGYTSEYSIDNGVTWNKYTTPIGINSNSTVILGRLVKLGLTGEITTGNVTNIDKVAPKAFTPNQSNVTEDSFTITASTTDGDATAESGTSGIKEYVYYIKKSTDSTYSTYTSETIVGIETNKTYAGMQQNTTYNIYVEAIDKAGNKTKSEEINVTTGAIPDLTSSNVTFTYTPDTWTSSTVQVGISTTIEGYTLQYSTNEGSTWDNYSNAITVSNNTIILAQLYKDGQTGGIATGNVTNIDKVAPKAFTPTQSNITENSFTITASTTDGEATSGSGVSGIKEYVYYIKKSTDSTYTNATQTGTSKTYTGLQDGTTYNIYVEAIDNTGNKTTSSAINIATKAILEGTQIIGDGSFSTTMGVNTPKLLTGMEPVVIGTNGSTSKPTTEKQWYDYSIGSKKWANAKTADGSLWVWIPRYAYKITSGLGTSTTGTIDVVFVDVNNKNGSTTYSTTYPDVSGNAMTNFVVHPAFVNNTTNGGWSSNIPGFWVAKFEAGYAGGNNSVTKKATGLKYTESGIDKTMRNFYGDNQTDIHYPVFMGKTYSYNCINVGDAFRLSRALTNSGNPYGFKSTNADSHLMKNSEWGAVAYLSHSKYGVNGADTVYINNLNMNHQLTNTNVYAVTGYAGASVSAGANSMSSVPNLSGDNVSNGSVTSYAWYTTQGQMASSNNNITGVYDLSGGLWECTAGYVNNGHSSLTTYGRGLVGSNAKYIRVYPLGTADNAISNYVAYTGYGDALKEVSSSGNGSNGWSGDITSFPFTGHPFFRRGGGWHTGNQAGLWHSYSYTVVSYSVDGFRACVVGVL